jgi:transaldolase
MAGANYMEWLSRETPTTWWHDSAEPAGVTQALAWGATGVTTNPVLSYAALKADPDFRRSLLRDVDPALPAAQRAEAMMRSVVTRAAAVFQPLYASSGGRLGYVCAQVSPLLCSQRDEMLAAATRYSGWAPNISVKLPATAAGMAVLEECAARGTSATSTVSFTVAQAVAAAEAVERGARRARAAGITPAPCYAVIMIGRIDDYLREVVTDNSCAVTEADINLAGLAIVKRAYRIFQERKYSTQLLIAALRGVHHMTGLCGAHLVMSLHPSVQKPLLSPGVPRVDGIDQPVPEESVRRLETITDFRSAYEADGLPEKQFITFGVTQKTLGQFAAGGWSLIEAFKD